MRDIFKRSKNVKKGFTLTEMLAVLLVMGVLFMVSATPFGSIKKAAVNDQFNTAVSLIEDSASTVIRRVKDLDTYLTDESLIKDLNRYLAGSAKLELERTDSGNLYKAEIDSIVIILKPDKTQDNFLLKAYLTERDYMNDTPELKETISYSGITAIE